MIILRRPWVGGWTHHNLLGSGRNLHLGNGQSTFWQPALSFSDRGRQCVYVCVWECETDHCMGRVGGGGWSLTRKRSAEGKFPFCQRLRGKKKKTNEKLHPAQRLHHNDPHNIVLLQDSVLHIRSYSRPTSSTFQGSSNRANGKQHSGWYLTLQVLADCVKFSLYPTVSIQKSVSEQVCEGNLELQTLTYE